MIDRARYIGIFIDGNGEYNKLEAEQVQKGLKLEGVAGAFKLSYKDREEAYKHVLVKQCNE